MGLKKHLEPLISSLLGTGVWLDMSGDGWCWCRHIEVVCWCGSRIECTRRLFKCKKTLVVYNIIIKMKNTYQGPETRLEPLCCRWVRHRCGRDVTTRLGVYVCGGHRDASRWARCVLSPCWSLGATGSSGGCGAFGRVEVGWSRFGRVMVVVVN